MSFFKRSIQIAIFTLAFLSGTVSFADACHFRLEVTYPDGEKGCLTDLPLAKATPKGWGSSISSLVKGSGGYVVAASAKCAEVGIGLSTVSGSYASPLSALADTAAVGSCSKECDCSVVVNRGRVLIPKHLAMALTVNNSDVVKTTAVEEQRLRVEKLREQQLSEEAKLREQEQEQKQTLMKEQQQLAAAEKLRQQKKFDEELQLREQVRLNQEAKKQEEARLFEASRLRKEQIRLESEKLNEDALIEQQARLKDRELLAQLTIELARLRAESANAKPSTTPVISSAESSKNNPIEPQTIFANRKALVIGNDSYKYVSKLANAREDARVIADNLTNVGFKVTLRMDLTEKEMKATLRGFKAQVEAGDEVAFFYAGHGVQLANSNFLVPIDVAGEGEEQIKDEGIALQRVLDDISEKKAKFTIAMIDACRDNPFKSNGRAIGGSTRGLAPTTAATGQMIIFSAGTGQQALDKLGSSDKEKNGLFTRIFVREMQKKGLSVDRLVRNVRAEVVDLAKSVGHEQVPAIYDQVVGEFYFKK